MKVARKLAANVTLEEDTLADFLIAHLNAKGGEHSSLAMLVSQWGFDSQLIPKALQSVGTMFPHYSRHDESHSKQILVNIERLLGSNINRLTATDTWLILEAAYWHDIGMVVPKADIAEALQEQGFRDYIEDIRTNPSHDLSGFARSFNSEDMTSCFAGAADPTDAIDKFRQLMSEWFRRKHPARAEEVVSSPGARVGIDSPRTELIPKRLFRLLGRICHMHGLPFDAVVGPQGLPYREAGLAREDCHPRFVACLLRLGDLLDVDDNRFCPVMQRIAGDNRPALSKAHEDKHQALRHLRFDQDRIELDAECETIDGYVETFRWFDWIRQEIQDQMASWQDIVPKRAFGMLPTLGRISVRISGETQILDEGVRPQFIIDNKNVLKILQGTNLYASEYACMRELLQNAVDATLMRIWVTQKAAADDPGWADPYATAAAEMLKKHSVRVEITEKDSKPFDANTSIWTIKIIDQGTGISREDLQYMLCVGGSKRNTRRRATIGTMPEWMKPSGIFGIGFQSVFMITEEVNIKTKSILTGECLNITMHKPGGPNDGLALIKTEPNDPAQASGTTIEFELPVKRFESRWGRNLQKDESAKNAFLKELDALIHASFPLAAAELADEVTNFGIESLIQVGGELRTSQLTFDTGISHPIEPPKSKSGAWRVVHVGQDVVGLRYAADRRRSGPYSVSVYYRGQKIAAQVPIVPYVKIEINIMSGQADGWLTASRDQLAASAVDKIRKLIVEALELQVQIDVTDRANRARNKSSNSVERFDSKVYSLFVWIMALWHGGNWTNIAREAGDHWKDLTFDQPNVSFRDFLEGPGGIILTHRAPTPELLITRSDAQGGGLSEHALPSTDKPGLFDLLVNAWCEEQGGTVCVVEPAALGHEERAQLESRGSAGQLALASLESLRYRLERKPQPQFSDSALCWALSQRTRNVGLNQRYLLVDNERWSKLRLRTNTEVRIGNLLGFAPPNSHFLVLPFFFRSDDQAVEAEGRHFESLCEWSRTRLETPIGIGEIRDEYSRMIKEIDSMMSKSDFADDWKVRRAAGAQEASE